MSCIIAWAGKYCGSKKMIMMGDSQGTKGDKSTRVKRKIFRTTNESGDEALLGATGSLRVAQVLSLIQFPWISGPEEEGMVVDKLHFMIKEFVPAYRELLAEHGVLQVEKGIESASAGSSVIVAYRGEVFGVESTFGVCTPRPSGRDEEFGQYVAIGSGANDALAAMDMYVDLAEAGRASFDPREMLEKALEIVSHHNIYISGPFDPLEAVLG